jgi:uncharacterized delta-60 repeat protein
MRRAVLTQVAVAFALATAGANLTAVDAQALLRHPHVEMAVDSSGRVVAALGGGSRHRAGVARLTPTGELDASFAGDGTIGPRASKRASALALAPAPGGKIVVAQELVEGRPILRRFHSDGRLDRSFGRRGTVPIPALPKNRLLPQPDGHVVVLIQRTCPSWSCGYRYSYLEILRYDPRGKLVSKRTYYNENWEFRAAAIDARGYFVVAGSDEGLAYSTFARFRPGGRIDPSLGGPEGLRIDESRFGEPEKPGEEVVFRPFAMAIQPDGGFVLAIDNGLTAISRRNRDGTRDAGFGNGGEAECTRGEVPEGSSFRTKPFRAVAAAADGAVLAAGGYRACGLVRYLPGGEPDPAFGDAGHVDLEALGFPRPVAIALAPDGKIVVAGWDTATRSVKFARLLTDGRLDPGFGSGGIATLAGF